MLFLQYSRLFFFFFLSVSVPSKQALLDLPAFVLRFSRSHAPNLSQNLIYNHFFLYFHPGSLIFPAVFQAHKWVWSWAFGYLSGYPWASLNHQNTALSHYYWLLPCQLLPSSTLMVCLFNSICHRIPVLLHSPPPPPSLAYCAYSCLLHMQIKMSSNRYGWADTGMYQTLALWVWVMENLT